MPIDPVPAERVLASLEQLRRQWIAGLPRQLERLDRFIAAEDWPAAREDAHRLRGTSGTHGLQLVYAPLGALEQLCARACSGELDRNAIDAARAKLHEAADALVEPQGR